MKPTLVSHLDRAARNLSPFAVCVLLVPLGMVPLPMPGYTPVAPAVALIAVYYWSIYRPDLLPAVAVFAIGLLQDLLSGVPLGVNTLVLLMVHRVVTSQRRFFHGKPFLVLWWSFMLVAAGVALMSWVLVALLVGTLIDPRPVIAQYLLTLALFPGLTWVLVRAQRAFLKQA